MNTLGIDPGGTTGVVILQDSQVYYFAEWNIDKVFEGLESWVRQCQNIAIERFVITPKTATNSRQLDALYVIGAVLYVAQRFHREVKLQSPANAKQAFPNEVLKEMGMFDKVRGQHARDALRHALLAERFAS